jgi:hypothetical protein
MSEYTSMRKRSAEMNVVQEPGLSADELELRAQGHKASFLDSFLSFQPWLLRFYILAHGSDIRRFSLPPLRSGWAYRVLGAHRSNYCLLESVSILSKALVARAHHFLAAGLAELSSAYPSTDG